MNALARRTRPGPHEKKTIGRFFLYISPWLIGFALFTILPLALSFIFSFTNVSMATVISDPWEFIGLKNYISIFTQDDDFKRAILNTFVFASIKVAFLVLFALLIAMLLNTPIVGRKIFRVMIYLPAIIPAVSVALLWRLIFTGGEFNVANYLLSYLGFQRVNFFGNGVSSMGVVIFVSIWGGLGPTMLILLAALQDIPKDIQEAALLDGANAFQRFLHITLPTIYPAIFFSIVTGLIGSLQEYTETKLLTEGGPGNATLTMSMSIVGNAFKTIGNKTLGYASAQGWVVFLLTFILTLIYFEASKKRNNEGV
jgi:multiple sugar transport system permease protein